MAMSMRVTNANGRVIATKRAGMRSYHQHDALGNTIALINDSGVVTDTYAYWPYGELRTSTGTTVNPFKFCGAWGYYTDTTGRVYVRARTLRPGLTRWMTVDPLWPEEPSYKYAATTPIDTIDRDGHESDFGGVNHTGKNIQGISGTVTLPSKMWAPTKDDKIMMYVGIADYAEAGVSHARVNGVCGRWAFLTCSGRPAPGSPRPLSVSCGATVPVALKIVRPQKGRAEVVASINKNIILRCPWAGGASGGMGKVRFSDFWFRATDKTSHSDDGMWSGLSLLDTKYENFSWTKDYVLVHGGEYVVTLLKPPVKASFFLRGCNVCDCGPVAEESNEGA